jgi:arylsulfatase A
MKVSSIFAFAASTMMAVAATPAPRPNLVVLLADDLGWQDIGCYGGPVKTPVLDALAAGGTRFTDFYSGCAVCSPLAGHALNGTSPTSAPAFIRGSATRGSVPIFSSARSPSPSCSRRRAMPPPTSANGISDCLRRNSPNRRPPSTASTTGSPPGTTPSRAIAIRRPSSANGEPVGEIEGYSCQIVVDEAIAWLDAGREKDQPFFLNVWFHEPHAPIAAPDEIVAEYGEVKNKNAIYSGTIDNTDRAIARLLAKLREVAPAEDTLVVYFSDNGSYLRDRVGNLRGAKGTNWDGGIRVPGIFSWPGKVAAGKVEATPAGHADLLPTVCGLFGFEPPAGVHLDGSDLTPLLDPKSGREFVRHQPLYWHLQKSRPIVALRDGRWSLTADPDYELSTDNLFREEWIPAIKRGGYTNWQLFDLEADPSQENNLADSNPEILTKLQTKLLGINASVMADGADWHLPPNP